MKRIQFFEFCDMVTLPALLRSATPVFLEAVFRSLRTYRVAVKPLAEVLRATRSTEILDLGSGGAGPLPQVLSGLAAQENLHVVATLSDKFPNTAAFSEAVRKDPQRLSFLPHSVSATAVPKNQAGVRTLFQLLHHFPPETAQAILQDAVSNRRGIAIFEVTQRHVLGLVLSLFLPLLVLLVTPFVRPVRFSRLFFTYLVPVLPCVVLWDSLISHLRSYTEAELLAMTRNLSGPAYVWKVQTLGRRPFQVLSLLGYPQPPTPGHKLGQTGEQPREVAKLG